MKYKHLLILVFLLVLGVRLFAVFQTPHFTYETYDLFRQTQSILDNGVPLFEDPLSHGGRDRVFNPIYSYILAFFGLFMSLKLVFSIIPNLFGALTIFVVYLLVYKITNSEGISVLFSLISGFIPVLFLGTVNNASILNLAIPVFLLTIYYFLLTNADSKHAYKLIFALIFLTLLHPISIVLAIGLVIYLILLKVKNFRESIREPEVVLFFSFFVLWINTVVYKTALVKHKSPFIWQNIPSPILNQSYSQIGFIEAVYGIGSIVLIFGVLSIYFNLFDTKRKSVTLFMSLAIIFSLLLLFKISEVFNILIFLGITLCVLSSYAFFKVYELINNFKHKFMSAIFILFILVIQFILFIPSYYAATSTFNSPTELDVNSALFMKNLTDSKILTQYYEGHFVSYVSGQKTAIDSDFLLVSNVDKLYSDASGVYRDRFLTNALGKLTRLDVTHIFLSERHQLNFMTSSLLFDGSECVKLIYGDESYEFSPKIYEVRCTLE
jgi:hypothetical protein